MGSCVLSLGFINKNRKKEFMTKKLIPILLIIVSLIGFYFHVTTFGEGGSKLQPVSQEVEKITKEIIVSRLTSPGSAQFVDFVIIKKLPKEENTYIAFGDVDSQNGFGALLRTHFYITLKKIGDNIEDIDSWKIEDLELDNVLYISEGEKQENPLHFNNQLIELKKKNEKIIREIYEKTK